MCEKPQDDPETRIGIILNGDGPVVLSRAQLRKLADESRELRAEVDRLKKQCDALQVDWVRENYRAEKAEELVAGIEEATIRRAAGIIDTWALGRDRDGDYLTPRIDGDRSAMIYSGQIRALPRLSDQEALQYTVKMAQDDILSAANRYLKAQYGIYPLENPVDRSRIDALLPPIVKPIHEDMERS